MGALQEGWALHSHSPGLLLDSVLDAHRAAPAHLLAAQLSRPACQTWQRQECPAGSAAALQPCPVHLHAAAWGFTGISQLQTMLLHRCCKSSAHS